MQKLMLYVICFISTISALQAKEAVVINSTEIGRDLKHGYEQWEVCGFRVEYYHMSVEYKLLLDDQSEMIVRLWKRFFNKNKEFASQIFFDHYTIRPGDVIDISHQFEDSVFIKLRSSRTQAEIESFLGENKEEDDDYPSWWQRDCYDYMDGEERSLTSYNCAYEGTRAYTVAHVDLSDETDGEWLLDSCTRSDRNERIWEDSGCFPGLSNVDSSMP